MSVLRLQTGRKYDVVAEGDGSVHARFVARLEAVEFDGPTFNGLLFDNGVRLWTFNEAVTFECREVQEVDPEGPLFPVLLSQADVAEAVAVVIEQGGAIDMAYHARFLRALVAKLRKAAAE